MWFDINISASPKNVARKNTFVTYRPKFISAAVIEID
jgi:hypothetical protein